MFHSKKDTQHLLHHTQWMIETLSFI